MNAFLSQACEGRLSDMHCSIPAPVSCPGPCVGMSDRNWPRICQALCVSEMKCLVQGERLPLDPHLLFSYAFFYLLHSMFRLVPGLHGCPLAPFWPPQPARKDCLVHELISGFAIDQGSRLKSTGHHLTCSVAGWLAFKVVLVLMSLDKTEFAGMRHMQLARLTLSSYAVDACTAKVPHLQVQLFLMQPLRKLFIPGTQRLHHNTHSRQVRSATELLRGILNCRPNLGLCYMIFCTAGSFLILGLENTTLTAVTKQALPMSVTCKTRTTKPSYLTGQLLLIELLCQASVSLDVLTDLHQASER